MRVASRENPKFKELRRLADSPLERQRTRSTVLEGVHLCQAYLERIGTPRLCAIAAGARSHAEIDALIGAIPAARVVEFDDALFSAISQLEEGIGLMFVIDMPPLDAAPPLRGDAILLDRIQDPGNLGTLLRSAAAAGFATAYLSAGCATAWGPRVLRAAMGAHFGMRLHEQCDLQGLVRESDVPVYATTARRGRLVFDLALAEGACAWVFGNEGQGVEPDLLNLCEAVQIPQPGGEESLNVAAAAAICLFEVVRQRHCTAAAPR